MKRLFLFCLLAASFGATAAPWADVRPKLVVVIVIDQFRADYISRYQHLFSKNGFMALINNGAYFPYGEYDVLQSMTGPGHATVLTGAYPYQMGIPINEWYDQKQNAVVYCVQDDAVKTVGAGGGQGGSSPKNLLGTTVGDEIKNADFPAKVVAVALKDRAAILLGGHRADLAVWFDSDSRLWVTSTYYRKSGKLPEWLEKLNKTMPQEKCNLMQPCGANVTVNAVKAALQGEKLGQTASSDLLAISFSSHDFAGHHFGPNSEEIKAMTLAEDKAIAEIRAAVQAKVGLKNAVFVLTGDHGVAPTPEYLSKVGIEAGRIDESALVKEMNAALTKKYGAPKQRTWVAYVLDFNFFLDEENVRQSKIDIRSMEADMKAILLKNPGIAQVFTGGEFENHQLPPGMFERKINRTYYRGRSGHVIAIQKPFYINDAKHEANHMTGYTYDRTVPIIFSGFGIKNGLYSTPAEVVDIAPTISFLMGVLPPALSEGHVLSQAISNSR